ncbi:hypothetical protein, partial [Escherichia coli]|uniref:hypothetical protein n=1 Tax=Escherichia coli TaxID=562 RepID=UPI001BFBFDAF
MKDYLCKKLFNRLSGTLVIRARCGNNITGLACCNILYPSPRYSGQLHIKELYVWHCCKVSDEAAFCLIQRPYISKTLLT